MADSMGFSTTARVQEDRERHIIVANARSRTLRLPRFLLRRMTAPTSGSRRAASLGVAFA